MTIARSLFPEVTAAQKRLPDNLDCFEEGTAHLALWGAPHCQNGT